MSNTLLTPSMIAKESLRILENNLVFARACRRDYDDEFKGERKVGDTINIRVPSRYKSRTGPQASIQNHVDKTVPLQLTTQRGIDVAFSSKDLTLNLDDFSERVLKPQIIQLANDVDFDGLANLYKLCPNAVGTPGTTPSALLTYLNGGVKLDNESCPQDEQRNMLVNPIAQATIVDALKGLMQDASSIASQYKRGKMGVGAGFDWAMSQNIPVHISGAQGGTPLVNGNATADGATSVSTKGWTAAAAVRLKAGDVFTIANVNAVNPLNRQSVGQLRQFVVTSDFSSDGSGNGSVGIYPAIQSTGAYQNVDSLPVDGAAITVLFSSSQQSPVNLAYHKDAFVLGMADLPLPKNMEMAARANSKEAGISIRFIRGYDVYNDLFVSRLDVLYGYAAVRPEWACRVQG